MQFKQALNNETLELPQSTLIPSHCNVFEGLLIQVIFTLPTLDAPVLLDRGDLIGEVIEPGAKIPAARFNLARLR